jgi:hypothetical protein
MPIVNYNMPNLQKCRCFSCPVHQASQCITQKMAGKPMPPPELPDPYMVEGLYCSAAVSRSACTDLNRSLTCICPTCPVWQENGLQTNYFCMKGPAS